MLQKYKVINACLEVVHYRSWVRESTGNITKTSSGEAAEWCYMWEEREKKEKKNHCCCQWQHWWGGWIGDERVEASCWGWFSWQPKLHLQDVAEAMVAVAETWPRHIIEVEHRGGKPMVPIFNYATPASTALPLLFQPVVNPTNFLFHFKREIDYSKHVLIIFGP